MAGEGAFANAVASIGAGMQTERDRQRDIARTSLLDNLLVQKEGDARNKADFQQSLSAREAGLVPQQSVQNQYDQLSASPLQQATDRIQLAQTPMGAPSTADGAPPAPMTPPPVNVDASRVVPSAGATALQHAAGLLSGGDSLTMPTSHGPQTMLYDYASSKNAREAAQEAQKQMELLNRQDAKDADAADRAAKAPVILGPGQNRYDAQGNIIAGGPAAKPTYKAVQKADGTWTSVDEATGLDPSGKPVVGIVPKDPNATGAGTWEITSFTKNGVIQEHNSKTGAYRDAPAGLAPKDQDNPQQLMQGTRGVQGARMMLLAHQQMAPFEAAATKDPSKFTGWDQFQAQFANDFASGHITNLSNAERSAAMVNLNKTNPDLAQYIRSGLYYAFGENELQQRPSDFRTKMSDYLATIGPAMNPAQIGQVSSMREESMRPAIEMAARLRQRMKLAPDPMFGTYLGTSTAPDAGGNVNGNAVDIDALMAKHGLTKKPE